MVVLNHASNVVGTLLPLEPVGEICRNQGILFLVDAAQTAGVIPIALEKEKIDFWHLPAIRPFSALREPAVWSSAKGWMRKAPQPLKGEGREAGPKGKNNPIFFPIFAKAGPQMPWVWPGLRPAWNLSLESAWKEFGAGKKIDARLIQGLRNSGGDRLWVN